MLLTRARWIGQLSKTFWRAAWLLHLRAARVLFGRLFTSLSRWWTKSSLFRDTIVTVLLTLCRVSAGKCFCGIILSFTPRGDQQWVQWVNKISKEQPSILCLISWHLPCSHQHMTSPYLCEAPSSHAICTFPILATDQEINLERSKSSTQPV